MGKYMRKPKLTGDTVAVIDVSPSSLGVRTRAKTLALQKLQQASNSTTVTPPEHHGELCYLQLRSRRLEKPPVQKSTTCCRRQNPNPNFVNTSGGEETQESNYYFGENNVDFDGRERTRESTPCSLIKDVNVISTPGSSTRPRNIEVSNRITQNSVTRSMPLALEIEEFFVRHEQEQHRRFADKYNFDMMNENPLEGRYEWVRVESQ